MAPGSWARAAVLVAVGRQAMKVTPAAAAEGRWRSVGGAALVTVILTAVSWIAVPWVVADEPGQPPGSLHFAGDAGKEAATGYLRGLVRRSPPV